VWGKPYAGPESPEMVKAAHRYGRCALWRDLLAVGGTIVCARPFCPQRDECGPLVHLCEPWSQKARPLSEGWRRPIVTPGGVMQTVLTFLVVVIAVARIGYGICVELEKLLDEHCQ
jgi:hypothetical protein